jgi:predicted PurR-regulated permease PerM
MFHGWYFFGTCLYKYIANLTISTKIKNLNTLLSLGWNKYVNIEKLENNRVGKVFNSFTHNSLQTISSLIQVISNFPLDICFMNVLWFYFFKESRWNDLFPTLLWTNVGQIFGLNISLDITHDQYPMDIISGDI